MVFAYRNQLQEKQKNWLTIGHYIESDIPILWIRFMLRCTFAIKDEILNFSLSMACMHFLFLARRDHLNDVLNPFSKKIH